MNNVFRIGYVLIHKVKNALHRLFVEPVIRKCFGSCGKHVRIPRNCRFSGIENIHVGEHVYFGPDFRVLSTRAHVMIGNYVMFGPGVTIITGNHRTDLIGKYMCQVTDKEKHPEDDREVVIEDDVWIGANTTILNGVTIGRGSVVAACSVVTKSCPPYSVIAGVPARTIKSRFTPEQIAEHERRLMQR